MTRDELERLYVDERWPLPRLAERFAVTPAAVRAALLDAGIPIRRQGRPERALVDVCARRRLDRERHVSARILDERIRAVIDARDHDAGYPLRDALVDLAATCLDAADRLPAPA